MPPHPQLWYMDRGFVVLPGQGRILDLGNFQAVVLAAGDHTSGDLAVLQTQNEPPGFGPPLHRHRDAAEAFFVLEGEYLMFLDDEQHRCPQGAFVYVPRNVPHTFKVSSEGPGRKLNLFTPAAMVGFFEELAAAEESGTATPSALEGIATRHNMEVLGPVPDSYL
jgi:mannose-6-phosphate isomerase-like protein (cupin superfamily)